MLFLNLILIATSINAIPVDGIADNTSQILPIPVSSTSACVKLVDDRNLPQLVFPICTSKHSSDSLTNVILHGIACTCDLNNNRQLKRDDYHYVMGVGAYKIHTREDQWVTILGDSLHKHGYTKWSNIWGVQPDNGGGVQHCGALMKDGGMDDVNCRVNYAFFCEISEI
ncbi:hypothetical protein HCN44_000797 [Aphidius gifuensis]|uniref:C-type lectin domain-containing protein n=1 Tax=Aphidius gifuensis TaxID=684658 RepID=A0A835CP71_APHGI|nr:hypothetical protein HCN44_000797 [Aphidius gifuensis]